jgi:hypothetical protein
MNNFISTHFEDIKNLNAIEHIILIDSAQKRLNDLLLISQSTKVKDRMYIQKIVLRNVINNHKRHLQILELEAFSRIAC